MLERIALLVLFAIIGYGAYRVLRLVHMRRMSQAHALQPVAAGATGTPTMLYFRGDSCAVCPAQSRYVDQVAQSWDGRVAIRRIDAEREPDTASRYGVFSLPTTILVDAGGHVREVNYGLIDAHKLGRQVQALVE